MNRKKNQALFLLLLFLLAGAVTGCREQKLTETELLANEDCEKALENVLPSSVKIQMEGYHGSGSIFEVTETEIVIATGRHVLQYFNEDSYIIFYGGIQKKGRLLFMSETADVGFAGIPLSSFTKEELASFKKIRKQKDVYDALSKDTGFFMPDLWEEQQPAYLRGSVGDKEKYIAEFDAEMLYGDGEARAGMSGCGIFDGYGNYIGLLSGATEHYEIAGVPLPVIWEEYEKMCK